MRPAPEGSQILEFATLIIQFTVLPAYRAISSNEPSIRYKWSEVEGSGLLGIMRDRRIRIYIIWFVIALWPSDILVPCNGSITIESANKDWCECAPKRTVAYCRGRRHTLHTSAQIDCGVGCIELIGPDYDAIISLVRKFPYKNVHSDSPIRKSLSGFPCYQRSFQHTLSQVSTKSTFLIQLEERWREHRYQSRKRRSCWNLKAKNPEPLAVLKLEDSDSKCDWSLAKDIHSSSPVCCFPWHYLHDHEPWLGSFRVHPATFISNRGIIRR